MSHTDYISKVPEGFRVIAQTEGCPVAAMENQEKKLYAFQFHPEVEHSREGIFYLKTFSTVFAAVKAIGLCLRLLKIPFKA